MANNSKTTSDHAEVRSWAEERGGKPSHVATTGASGDVGILRIEFPGAAASNDANLQEISWDEFFEKFDAQGLALLYQEDTAGGEKSNFNKLVSAGTAAKSPRGSGSMPSSKRPPHRKSSTPKKAVKKSAVKTAPAKAPAKKKQAARPLKKVAAKKAARPVAKKSAVKKPPAKKFTVKKSSVKKTAAKKAVAKKMPAKTAVRKSVAAKKTAARKRR